MRTDSQHWLASWPCSGVAGGTVAHRRSIRQMPNQEVLIEHPGQGPRWTRPRSRTPGQTCEMALARALPGEPGSASPSW